MRNPPKCDAVVVCTLCGGGLLDLCWGLVLAIPAVESLFMLLQKQINEYIFKLKLAVSLIFACNTLPPKQGIL